MGFDIEVDNLTVVLLLIIAALLVYNRFFTPLPLVHPLLLAKQVDVSAICQPGESGVYRAWATGHGAPFQVRPANQFKTVNEAVNVPQHIPVPGKKAPPMTQRHVLDTPLTNEALAEVARLVPIGLKALFPSQLNGTREAPKPIVTLLPASPQTSLPLLLLSLASRPSAPLVVLPHPRLLNTALTSTAHPTPALVVVHESILEKLVDEAFEDVGGADGLLIVGDPTRSRQELADKAASLNMSVKWWEDIWDAAEKADQINAAAAKEEEVLYSDVHSWFYTIPVEYSTRAALVKITHMNFTAGVAALLAAFPADKRPNGGINDVIASAIRLDTPFGMTIALAALWSGAGFRLIGPRAASWDNYERDYYSELEDLAKKEQPPATILFLTAKHNFALVSEVHNAFIETPLAAIAARRQLKDIRVGFVSRDSWTDKLLISAIRREVLGGVTGDKLRAVVVVNDAPPTSLSTISSIVLSLPTSRLYSSPYSAGPVFASHFHDLQSEVIPDAFKKLTPELLKADQRGHTGGPTNNVEVVLKGKRAEPKPKGKKAAAGGSDLPPVMPATGAGKAPSAIPGQESEAGAAVSEKTQTDAAPASGTTEKPAGSNAEAKDAKVERDEPLIGRLWIRGPAVLDRVPPHGVEIDGWVDTEEYAAALPNGTFVLLDGE